MEVLLRPLTAHAVLAIAVVGVALVLVAESFPPNYRPAPKDWDPIAWRKWQTSHRPRETLLCEYRRALIAIGYTAFDRARAFLLALARLRRSVLVRYTLLSTVRSK